MIKKKNLIISALTAMLIVTLAVMCFYANTMGAKLQVNVRNVELNAIELDYSSIINQFENAKVTKEGSVTTFEGYQTLDASLFEDLDNVSESDIESSIGCQIKYNFTYDSEANIVTLSAIMENGEKLEIEEIYGSAFIDENGRLDAVMDFDGEYVLLSEMQDMGLIKNCGWFSRLFKKVVKAVVAVAAVAVCVATAGAGVAAVIAIGAAVGAAESVATQLLETGKVSLGAVLVDTALGAIPGGTGAKTVAKESIKAGAEIAAKKATKVVTNKTLKSVGFGNGSFKNTAECLTYHFNKHGKELGVKTVKEYEELAKNTAETVVKNSIPAKRVVTGATPGVYRYELNGNYIHMKIDNDEAIIVSFGKI